MRRIEEPVDWSALSVGREVRLRYREGDTGLTLVATVLAVTERNVVVRAWGTTHTFSLHRSVVIRVRPMTGPAVVAARAAIGEAQRQRLMRIKAGGS